MAKVFSFETETPESAEEGRNTAGSESQETTQPAELNWFQALEADDDDALQKAVSKEISAIIAKHKLTSYEVLFLCDDVDSISSYHADQLYAAASSLKTAASNILLVIQSNGGQIEPAYLLSKALKRLAKNKFVAVVPRRAKSAATLVALGADEIHMGLMSQLGPIDPQLYGLPVLALSNALDVIADLTCRFPAASEMFTKYLVDQVPIRILGYHQRVSESAAQYAERLLGEKLPPDKNAEEVAKHLVQHYKDHDFVIDSDEAQKLLGDDFVKHNTSEYRAADRIYKFLRMVGIFLDMRGKEFWYVGRVQDGLKVREKREKK